MVSVYSERERSIQTVFNNPGCTYTHGPLSSTLSLPCETTNTHTHGRDRERERETISSFYFLPPCIDCYDSLLVPDFLTYRAGGTLSCCRCTSFLSDHEEPSLGAVQRFKEETAASSPPPPPPASQPAPTPYGPNFHPSTCGEKVPITSDTAKRGSGTLRRRTGGGKE